MFQGGMGATGPPGEEGGAGTETLKLPQIHFLASHTLLSLKYNKLHNTKFKMLFSKFLMTTLEFLKYTIHN